MGLILSSCSDKDSMKKKFFSYFRLNYSLKLSFSSIDGILFLFKKKNKSNNFFRIGIYCRREKGKKLGGFNNFDVTLHGSKNQEKLNQKIYRHQPQLCAPAPS
jgi:hypothetical protein